MKVIAFNKLNNCRKLISKTHIKRNHHKACMDLVMLRISNIVAYWAHHFKCYKKKFQEDHALEPMLLAFFYSLLPIVINKIHIICFRTSRFFKYFYTYYTFESKNWKKKKNKQINFQELVATLWIISWTRNEDMIDHPNARPAK